MKIKYSIDAIIYSDIVATQTITGVIEVFSNLWKNTDNINIPEELEIEIPLINN